MPGLKDIVARSKAMRETVRRAGLASKRDVAALLYGPSGSGKERLARAMHAESGRGAFVSLSCGAFAADALESELFGHEKGAFAGAAAQKTGAWEAAAGGTLFLREIETVPHSVQVKILRAWREKEFARIGGNHAIRAKARIVASTRGDLREGVGRGELREDFFQFLEGFPIAVPALAARRDDIPELAEACLRKSGHNGRMKNGVLSLLSEYPWPGNLRELESCLGWAAVFAQEKPLDVPHLPEHVRQANFFEHTPLLRLPQGGLSLGELEKSLILQALERAGGNKNEASSLLGITRRALYSKLETHRIDGYRKPRSKTPDA